MDALCGFHGHGCSNRWKKRFRRGQRLNCELNRDEVWRIAEEYCRIEDQITGV
jgi:hypothetical protein